MENNSTLIRWLYSCDKVVRTPDRNVTHFLLDGGKLDLTNDYEIFQEIYSKNISEKNCIVELKTEVFKLFIDFDVLTTIEFDMRQYIKIVQDTIKDIYSQDFTCIITFADKDKFVKRDSVEYIKKGYHFHWPEILVNKEISNKIRNMIIVRFTTIFGKIPEFYENWEKIIDKTVYDHNGLRILGADKCSISDGIKTYDNRVYIVHSVYHGNEFSDNLTKIYKNNTLKAIKDTSIRSSETEITKCNFLAEYELEDECSNKFSDYEVIKKDTNIDRAIKRFFNNYIEGYRVEDLRKIVKIKDKEIYIIESKSKFCQNINDYHSNNHIYFKITPKGFCQRCRSERIVKDVCCRNYESNNIQISTTLGSALGWKMLKTKTNNNVKDFNPSNILETLEENITGKPNQTKKDKKKLK